MRVPFVAVHVACSFHDCLPEFLPYNGLSFKMHV